MGTNYYRVPKSHEVVEKMQKLNMRVGELDLWSASDAKNELNHPDYRIPKCYTVG